LIGEGKDYFESTLISATRQFEKVNLLEGKKKKSKEAN